MTESLSGRDDHVVAHGSLDNATRLLVEGARHPPFLYDMGPKLARLALRQMQAPPVRWDDLVRHDVALPTAAGQVQVHVLTPDDESPGPVILYAHGGGWVTGGYDTHHRLATALCRDTGAVVVVPDYALAPEFRYPVASRQLSAVLAWIRARGLPVPADTSRVALVGDCAGATMAAALASADRAHPPLVAQALLYPLTLPRAGDMSVQRYATGAGVRYTDVLEMFRRYAPDGGDALTDPISRVAEPANVPPTLLVTAEADVTRDAAERYGARLRSAGAAVTAVRYLGAVHDFAVLDALQWTPAARAVRVQVAAYLRDAFATSGTAL